MNEDCPVIRNVCRLCMGTTSPVTVIANSDIATNILNCVAIHIKEDDPLPFTVCVTCINFVEKWKTFKDIATEVNKLYCTELNQLHSENACPDNVEESCTLTTDTERKNKRKRSVQSENTSQQSTENQENACPDNVEESCTLTTDTESKHKKKRKRKRSVQSENTSQQSTENQNELAPTPAHVSSPDHGVMVPKDGALNVFHQMTFSDLLRPASLVHHGIYYSYLEHKEMKDGQTEANDISPNTYLIEAKRLKHVADRETDPIARGVQYLEVILSFILTGHVLERKNQIDTAISMFSETLKLIVYISKKFRNYPVTAQSSIPNKIAVLSLRCESMLYLKLHKLREIEAREINNTINDYFSKPVPMEAIMESTPSPHSPAPSPGSLVGSQLSGYNSSANIAVSSNLHSMLQKQHLYHSNLSSCLSYWDEADRLIFQGNKEFFVELDRFCGPLTLHSSLEDLLHYVRVGIQRLKGIISHNQATNVNSLLPAV